MPADLTLAIQVLRYNALFDMIDRRTAASLLFVNKGISYCVQEYVRLPTRPSGFATPTFEPTATGCKIGDYEYDIPGFIKGDYIKCKGEIIPGQDYCLYRFYLLDQYFTPLETIHLLEKDYGALMDSYMEYLKRYIERHGT